MTSALEAFTLDDPHAFFHRLRAEDPVHYEPDRHAVILTRYDDVVGAFRDPRLSSRRVELDHLDHWMVFQDPPDHTRLRKLASAAFSPPAITRLKHEVAAITDDLLRDLSGVVDWLAELAIPLPAIVIAEMLGVPHDERHLFVGWSAAIAPAVFGRRDAARDARAAEGLKAFEEYLRSRPLALFEGATDQETLSTCTLLLFAGHTTTTGLLGTSVMALADDEALRRWLADDPARLPGAIEEFMRYEGPAGYMTRVVTEPIQWGDVVVEPGTSVYLGLTAANRDPARFEQPDRIIPDRHLNAHVGFGHGIHHCLGAPLARLETRVALEAILRRYPHMSLSERPVWGGGLLGRGLARLIVDLGDVG